MGTFFGSNGNISISHGLIGSLFNSHAPTNTDWELLIEKSFLWQLLFSYYETFVSITFSKFMTNLRILAEPLSFFHGVDESRLLQERSEIHIHLYTMFAWTEIPISFNHERIAAAIFPDMKSCVC
jgi:hypothetical protein